MTPKSLPSDIADPPLARIDGWPLTLAALEDAVPRIAQAAAAQEGFVASILDLERLAGLRADPNLSLTFRDVRFVIAGGASVARIARRQNTAIRHTTGADLLVALCQEASRQKLQVFLFGADDGALARAALNLTQSTDDDLDIAGTLAPAPDFDVTGAWADKAIARIAASGAHLCFVALPVHQQERFAVRAVGLGAGAGFVCIGDGIARVAGQTRFMRSGTGQAMARRTGELARQALLLLDLSISGEAARHPDRAG